MSKKKLTKFARAEYKYILTESQYKNIIPELQSRMAADEYGKNTVMNIYYDTPDYRLIRASIEKPEYKEKLRLRSYGVPKEDSTVFLELKKKYHKIVYKRRVEGDYFDILCRLNSSSFPDNSQIWREIAYFISFYKGIAPKMFISYEREAYFDRENPALRISFDTNVTYRCHDLELHRGVYGEKLLKDGEHLMEIKVTGAFPLWLSSLLAENKIYKQSFSKYGKAYERIVRNA